MRGMIAPALVHERDLMMVTTDMELALMFALMEYDKRRHEQYRKGEYEFFSKILWPVSLIQAGPENYIGIDRMKFFFDLQFKNTQFLPPDSKILSGLKQKTDDHQSRLELLSGWVKEIETSIKKDLIIKGIIGPEILNGLVPIIKLATDKPITAVELDPIISTDDMIDIANQYNQALRNIEETISKWHSLQRRIEKKIDEWRTSHSMSQTVNEQEQIDAQFDTLNEKIFEIIWNCRSEIEYLFHWAISGQALNLVVPYTEIWIAMYLAAIKLPNNTKKFLLLPPSVLSEEKKSIRRIPVDSFHSSFYSILKERVESALETHAAVRNQIEGLCKAQNLFLKEDANKIMTRGINRIKEQNLIENKYIEELQAQWQDISQKFKVENLS